MGACLGKELSLSLLSLLEKNGLTSIGSAAAAAVARPKVFIFFRGWIPKNLSLSQEGEGEMNNEQFNREDRDRKIG